MPQVAGCKHRHRIVIAAAGVVGGLLLWLGPATGEAEAAKCKKASAPAYELAAKTARKATLCLVNRQRAGRNLPRLREHRAKRQAAERHTRAMIEKRCFAHQCPGEKSLLGRTQDTGYLPCKCSWGIGENIAWGSGRTSSPRRVVRAWMRSPGHRANILSRSFKHIGIGIRAGSPSGRSRAATYTTTFGYKR
jgi:uncharacterized protein YkwD